MVLRAQGGEIVGGPGNDLLDQGVFWIGRRGDRHVEDGEEGDEEEEDRTVVIHCLVVRFGVCSPFRCFLFFRVVGVMISL